MMTAYIDALRDPTETDRAVQAILEYDGSNVRIRKPYLLYRLGAVGPAQDAWRTEIANGRTLRAVNELSAFWNGAYTENLEEPSLPAFFEEVGLADYWRAHGDPYHCRAVGDNFECGES